MLLALFTVREALCAMPAVAQAIMISRWHCMQFLLSILRRLLHLAETALLRHGAQPRTIFFLATLSAFDSFIPMLPAEAFVVALGILQPKKVKAILLVFATASALSAWLLALVLGTLSAPAESLGLQLMGAQWDQALAMVRTWGPASMVLLAAFPDSPRTSIAALACCLLGGPLDRLFQVTVLFARSGAELVENGQMFTRLVQLARLHIGNANVLVSADVLGV
jgi:hypothetical protein